MANTQSNAGFYAALAATGAVLCSSPSLAATVAVSCPGTAITTDREFGLNTDNLGAVCLDTGTGNIDGNSDAINRMGYVTLDKTNDATSGLLPQALTIVTDTKLAGTFAINAPGFMNFVIAFKTGQGQLNPDWAVFALPAGVTSGSFSISGQQGLSHVNLYARPGFQVVPIPAAGWLFGTGLVGLLVTGRKRRR